MELSTILYRTSDGVAHVHFNRPKGANAVNHEFAADLWKVMVEIEWDDNVRAVSVTAEGKVFCGGGDLKAFNNAENLPRYGAELLNDLHSAIYKMNRIPKPFVVGVRGAAGGAGMSLLGAFDLAVASETAKFTMAYTKAGLTPDGTSTYFLSRHIGLRRMLDLTLTNRVLTATEAENWGLVNRLVPDDQVDTTTAELAQTLADGAPYATGMAKRVVYAGMDQALEQAGEYEGVTITEAMNSADGREGIAAFVEKRSPKWIGA